MPIPGSAAGAEARPGHGWPDWEPASGRRCRDSGVHAKHTLRTAWIWLNGGPWRDASRLTLCLTNADHRNTGLFSGAADRPVTAPMANRAVNGRPQSACEFGRIGDGPGPAYVRLHAGRPVRGRHRPRKPSHQPPHTPGRPQRHSPLPDARRRDARRPAGAGADPDCPAAARPRIRRLHLRRLERLRLPDRQRAASRRCWPSRTSRWTTSSRAARSATACRPCSR